MAQHHLFEENNSATARLLEAHIQSGNLNFLFGSGASLPAINVAGNIEAEINALMAKSELDAANLKALRFLEELEDVNTDVLANIESPAINETLQNYVDFLSIIDRILFERKNLLLPRQASIFTTNYDAFFESAASRLPTVILNDGFDRSSTPTMYFPFSPEKYFDRTYRSGNVYDRQSEMPTFNLIKVHGSLTWSKQNATEVYFSNIERKALDETSKEDPAKVTDALLKRAVILPNIRKFETTVLERVHFDLLRLYSNAMDRENALLISFGFSFGDEHILDITRRALRNPTSKLIVFAYSAKSAASFMQLFKQQRNVVVVSPTQGENIDFKKLNDLLGSIVPEAIESDD